LTGHLAGHARPSAADGRELLFECQCNWPDIQQSFCSVFNGNAIHQRQANLSFSFSLQPLACAYDGNVFIKLGGPTLYGDSNETSEAVKRKKQKIKPNVSFFHAVLYNL